MDHYLIAMERMMTMQLLVGMTTRVGIAKRKRRMMTTIQVLLPLLPPLVVAVVVVAAVRRVQLILIWVKMRRSIKPPT